MRRRSYRAKASLVRTRMPIRHYSWMTNQGAASTARRMRSTQSDTQRAGDDNSAAESDSPASKSDPSPETSTPIGTTAEDDASEATTADVPTAQAAANRIAAEEAPHVHQAPARHPELSASIGAIPNSPLRNAGRNSSIVAMAPLRGSLESLVRQNEKTDADNLERIENDEDLHNRIATHLLVPVPASEALTVNSSLPEDRRYCRPWTAKFLADLAHAHQAQFHHSFEVSSAVRTVEYQKRLMRTNGNAAPAEGDIASPHLTGATIDIAKSGMTRTELYWMRNRLDALQNQGKIDVEEEFRQSCFHITVYRSYVGAGPLHKPHHKTAPPPPDDDDAPAAVADSPATGQ